MTIKRCSTGCVPPDALVAQFTEHFDYCPYCGDRLVAENPVVSTTVYLHNSKNVNADIAHELGIIEGSDAFNRFLYTAYEVALELEVNRETGESKIVGIRTGGTRGGLFTEVVYLERPVNA